jgi:predicted O-methyltransferase YrrM
MPTFHEDWYYDGLLTELARLAASVLDLNGKYVEIGCWEGKSTISIANAIAPESLVCVDHWRGNLEESKASGTVHRSELIAKQRNVFATFVQNMMECTRQNFSVEKLDCVYWVDRFEKPIKFCHIDASNDYKSVHTMLSKLIPKMVPGGILCGYNFLSADLNEESLQGGVMRAVLEFFPDVEHTEELWYWRMPTA